MLKGATPNPVLFKGGLHVILKRVGSPQRGDEKADQKRSSRGGWVGEAGLPRPPTPGLFLRGRCIVTAMPGLPAHLNRRDTT